MQGKYWMRRAAEVGVVTTKRSLDELEKMLLQARAQLARAEGAVREIEARRGATGARMPERAGGFAQREQFLRHLETLANERRATREHAQKRVLAARRELERGQDELARAIEREQHMTRAEASATKLDAQNATRREERWLEDVPRRR